MGARSFHVQLALRSMGHRSIRVADDINAALSKQTGRGGEHGPSLRGNRHLLQSVRTLEQNCHTLQKENNRLRRFNETELSRNMKQPRQEPGVNQDLERAEQRYQQVSSSSPPTGQIARPHPRLHTYNGAPERTPGASFTVKDDEIKQLQEECQDLKNKLGCLKGRAGGQRPAEAEQLLRQSQKELLWLQRQLSCISAGGSGLYLWSPEKVSYFGWETSGKL
eukprot:gi/632978666/ref/XP_007906041.1/ PREDICTED: peripheral-type benzodiazepine receptor-associated protein 1-like [Callorhinchus milii]